MDYLRADAKSHQTLTQVSPRLVLGESVWLTSILITNHQVEVEMVDVVMSLLYLKRMRR